MAAIINRSDGIVGEIVEAATDRFVAQCSRERLHHPPVFGAFVKTPFEPGERLGSAPGEPEIDAGEDPFADPAPPKVGQVSPGTPEGTIYAVVSMASTGSLEPGRRASAYGLSEAELRAEQPQIFDLLTTEFSAVHVGCVQDGRLRGFLPPRPPRLHAFVGECAPEEVRALTESGDFLRSLMAVAPAEVMDELIAACLRHAYRCRGDDFAFLVRSGKQLAILLRDDPDRLAALLRKLEP